MLLFTFLILLEIYIDRGNIRIRLKFEWPLIEGTDPAMRNTAVIPHPFQSFTFDSALPWIRKTKVNSKIACLIPLKWW
jgi:hypothetical protein